MEQKIESTIFNKNSKLVYINSNHKAVTFLFRGGKCKFFSDKKQINSVYTLLAKYVVASRLPELDISVDNDVVFYYTELSSMNELKYISSVILQKVTKEEFDIALMKLKDNIRSKINSEEYTEYYKFESLISRIQKSTLSEISEGLEQVEFNHFKNFYSNIYVFSSMTLYIFGSESDKIIVEEILNNLDYKETLIFEIRGSTGKIAAKRHFKNIYGLFLNLPEKNRSISYFVLVGLINYIKENNIKIEFIFSNYEVGIYTYDRNTSIENFYKVITDTFVKLNEQELLSIVKKEISSIFSDLTFEEYSKIVPRLDYYGIDIFSNNQITDSEIVNQLGIIMPQIYSKQSYIY